MANEGSGTPAASEPSGGGAPAGDAPAGGDPAPAAVVAEPTMMSPVTKSADPPSDNKSAAPPKE